MFISFFSAYFYIYYLKIVLVVGVSDNNFKNRLRLSLCNVSSEFCWLTKGVARFVGRFCVNCQRSNHLQVNIINDIVENNKWSALLFLSFLYDGCKKQSNNRTQYTHSCPTRSYLPHKYYMVFPTTTNTITVYVCCFFVLIYYYNAVYPPTCNYAPFHEHTPFDCTCNSITFFLVLFYTCHTYYSKLW